MPMSIAASGKAGIPNYGTAETSENYLPAIGDAALGIVTAWYYSPYLDNPTNKRFIAGLKAADPDRCCSKYITTFGYDGMEMIFHMLKATQWRARRRQGHGGDQGLFLDRPERSDVDRPEDARQCPQHLHPQGREGERPDVQQGVRNDPDVHDQWHELHAERAMRSDHAAEGIGQACAAPAPTQDQIDEIGRRFLTTTEMVAEARRKLHPHSWDFVAGGSETEATLARNRLALDLWALRPRVLRDVLQESIDPSSSILGIKLRIPVIFAPVGGMTMLDPRGALGSVRAAAQFGAMTFISSVTEPDIDGRRPAPPTAGWCCSSISAATPTGSTPMSSARRRSAAAPSASPSIPTPIAGASATSSTASSQGTPLVTGGRTGVMENTGREHQERFNWKDIERVRRKFDLPVIIKGIATAEDAKIAVEHGVAVVYVSNHGGRQLDHGQGTLEILPEVVAAVNGQAEVMIDGGFVRGTDVDQGDGARRQGGRHRQAPGLGAGGGRRGGDGDAARSSCRRRSPRT